MPLILFCFFSWTLPILFRDGLIRNKIFKREVRNHNSAYYKLQSKVTEIYQKNENMIVGVAKSSSLLRHLDIYLQDTLELVWLC